MSVVEGLGMSAAGRARPGVVALSGPPASGKSTVAPRLATRLGPRSVCLEGDWFWTTITAGFIEPWRPEADGQNRAVLRAGFAAAAELATGGFAVVVDGVLGPWHLPAVTGLLAERGVDLDYVVLRADLATTLGRAAARAGDAPRVPGNPPLADTGPIRALWEQFGDLGAHERHVVDTTDLDAAATVDAVTAGLVAARFRVDAPR